jgi:two-component system chemotaxis response regulator CheY
MDLSRSRSILVVDDDYDIREALSEVLRDEGFSVHVACNGREAMDWISGHGNRPCMILLDLMMPVMDGATFLRLRKEDPALAPIPVVVITAGGDCQQLEARNDVQECIRKPISLPKLLAAMEACN